MTPLTSGTGTSVVDRSVGVVGTNDTSTELPPVRRSEIPRDLAIVGGPDTLQPDVDAVESQPIRA